MDQSRFIRGLLDDPRDPQLPQYDPAGGWNTAKNAGAFLASLTTPGAAADAAGYLGGPSMRENAAAGDYGDAALQALGLIPGVGLLGKAGVGAKMAMAAVPAAKAAKAAKQTPAGLLSAAEAITPGDIRISTRFPTGKTATEDPLREHLSIGAREMQADPEKYVYNVGLLSDYPGFAKLRGMAPDEAAQTYIDQTRGNLDYLYQRSPTIIRERSPRWYDGANRIAQAFADRYGIPLQSAGGAIAALSPQMDWFKNASLAERVGDVIFDPSKQRMAMTPEMRDYLASESGAKWTQGNAKNKAVLDRIYGKSLDDIAPDDHIGRAMWVRAYDEAHNPRSYRTIAPEGEFGNFAENMGGGQSKIGWGGLGEIGKAIRAYTSGGDMDVISQAMGEKHKVRSFNNNITVPNDPRYGDVTIDTHQVAAGQLRPLAGSSHAVAHNLATSVEAGMKNAKNSAVTGAQGTYGLIADATRQAAQPYGLLGRQMQSATWEPVRELFSAAAKRGSLPDQVDAIWRAHDAGDLSLQQARDLIYETAGGIGTPAWARSDFAGIDPRRGSSYR